MDIRGLAEFLHDKFVVMLKGFGPTIPEVEEILEEYFCDRHKKGIIIINGPRETDTTAGDTGQPLGQLEDPEGNLILIYSLAPVSLIGVMQKAIGRRPEPPVLVGGGDLIATSFDAHGFPSSYAYNPSPDNKDTNEVALYREKLVAWNARNAIIQAAIAKLMEGK